MAHHPASGASDLMSSPRKHTKLLSHLTPARKKHLIDGTLATVVYFVAQLLIWGVDAVITLTGKAFPGPIVAMILVWLVMLVIGWCWDGLADIYTNFLKGPTDLLNRHMSIGFTIPLIMIARQPSAKSEDIGLITALFVITGVLNALFAFVLAWASESAIESVHNLRIYNYMRRLAAWCNGLRYWQAIKDALSRPSSAPSPGFSSANTVTNSVSDGISGIGVGVDDKSGGATQLGSGDEVLEQAAQLRPSAGSETEEKPPEHPLSKRNTVLSKLRSWIGHNPVLCLCALFALIVGIPVCLVSHQDNVLDTSLLFTLWLIFQILQAGIKGCRGPEGEQHHGDEKRDEEAKSTKRGCDEKVRVVCASLLNSVLWTALAMMAYVKIKAAVQQVDFADALGALQSNITAVDVFSHNQNASAAGSSSPIQDLSTDLNSVRTEPSSLRVADGQPLHMQAGDIALSILDAGLVAWGLKLYECRRQLLSRSGFTVAFIAALAAVGNVCAGPILASKMRLTPAARDLSFAARSVTLALAVPAMSVLGGDAGLNAAMVVASGVLFQVVMGLGVGHWLDDRISQLFDRKKPSSDSAIKRWSLFRCSSCRGHGSAVSGDLETGRPRRTPVQDQIQTSQIDRTQPDSNSHDTRQLTARYATNTATDASKEEGAEGPDPPRTVAAGIMVGINAAAMGTAHLYEISSSAAPYSALAMTAYGVVTVILANALSGWLRGSVSA